MYDICHDLLGGECDNFGEWVHDTDKRLRQVVYLIGMYVLPSHNNESKKLFRNI